MGTLAFCLFLTLHSALPAVLIYGSETFGGGILHVFYSRPNNDQDNDNSDPTNSSQCDTNIEPVADMLYCNAVGTFIGAWVGAFPIPLDWDRSWQIWPITCCIGGVVG